MAAEDLSTIPDRMDRITGTPRPPSASTRQPALASFGGTANRPLTVSEIDLDQCDRIAMRLAWEKGWHLSPVPKKARKTPGAVAMSDEKKAEKTQVQILSDAFEGMNGRRPKSDKELNEWLATDEGRQATIFEPTSISRWGEIGHA
jgi:hypothetical protein